MTAEEREALEAKCALYAAALCKSDAVIAKLVAALGDCVARCECGGTGLVGSVVRFECRKCAPLRQLIMEAQS